MSSREQREARRYGRHPGSARPSADQSRPKGSTQRVDTFAEDGFPAAGTDYTPSWHEDRVFLELEEPNSLLGVVLLAALVASVLGAVLFRLLVGPVVTPAVAAFAASLAALGLFAPRSARAAFYALGVGAFTFLAVFLYFPALGPLAGESVIRASGVILAAALIDWMATHHVEWIAAQADVSDENGRARILGLWAMRFRPEDLRREAAGDDAFAPIAGALLSYAMMLLLFAPLLPLALLGDATSLLFFVPPALALIALAFRLREGLKRSAYIVWLALRCWLHYGRRGDGYPGVLQTAAGLRTERWVITVSAVALFAAALSPATPYEHILSPGALEPILFELVAGALLPLITLAALGFAILAPTLSPFMLLVSPELEDRLLGDRAVSPDATAWERTVRRILSAEPHEKPVPPWARAGSAPPPDPPPDPPKHPVREHILLGFDHHTGDPVLLPMAALKEHGHILGATGSGKTSRVIAPLATQLIRRGNDGPIVIIDMKGLERGDLTLKGLFEETKRQGRRFRFFTNRTGVPTFGFNPVQDFRSIGLNEHQLAGHALTAMNVVHGTGYGAGFFSGQNRRLMKELIAAYPGISSFRDLYAALDKFREPRPEDVRGRSGDTVKHKRQERENLIREAGEVVNSLYDLANVPALNVTRESQYFDERIDMLRAVQDGEVLYFQLYSHADEATAQFIACLALECLYAATIHNNLGPHSPPKPFRQGYVFIDEAQKVVGRNFLDFFQQARSVGLALILANQDRTSLAPPNTTINLQGPIQSNVGFQLQFSFRSLEDVRFMTAMGGTTHSDPVPGREHVPPRTVPRFTENVLTAIGAQPGLGIHIINQSGEGYARYEGFPNVIYCPHHISLMQKKKLEADRFPSDLPGSFTTDDLERESRTRTSDPNAEGEGAPRTERPVQPPVHDPELDRLFARIHIDAAEQRYTFSEDTSP